MANNKSLSKGGMYYLIYNVLNLAFPFVNGIYVARVLLPASIGAVAAAQNFAQYFIILAFLGIPTYGLREIAKARNNQEERSKVYSELFIINLISTITFLTVYTVLILIIPAYRNELALYLIAGISVALNAINISWLYEGMEEFKFISMRNLAFKTVAFLLLIFLVRDESDIYIYAFISVISYAGNYIVNMIYSPRYVKLTTKGLNLRRHMKSILYLVAVNLAIELYSLMDVTMMNFMCGKDSIAFYKYGYQIEKMLLQVVNTFTIVLIPRISFYYKEKKIDEFNRMISKALKLIIITSIPMMVGIYFTSDFLMVKMYGAQYVTSALILKMFSSLLLISPVGYLLGSRVLLVTGHENLMIVSVGIGALVNLIGNALLIPRYAEFGATVASIISEIVVMLVYVNLGKKHFKLEGIPQTAIKVLFSAVLMGVYLFACSLLPVNPWIVLMLQVAGAVAIYFIVLIVAKENVVVEYAQIAARKGKALIRR
ncbi:oligosaccharide flippase family protein [Butyrivibrio sp. YAB3001]|uniref:oligosaccharide flippase family protein n=1 Tax=Butyrivibrio sp. YAB3001 TaxID=1520812 RepID=UPI0008F68B09|nr:oligosaccharide flippase family protein [Butyrivibrio sp. YAB3001]SFC87345.1 Membrane protein involved in the export of O-antigen and teichoic acid [Butyrivibrio sp. YAB3001]